MSAKPSTKFDREKLKASWGSTIVPQSALSKFTGGAVSGQTLANERWMGKAPRGYKLNRRRVFDIDELLDWLESKVCEG